MKQEKNSKQHSVFLLDLKIVKRKCSSRKRKTAGVLKDWFEKCISKQGYEEQGLKTTASCHGFTAMLVYKKDEPDDIVSIFFNGIAEPTSKVLKDKKLKTSSSILFLWDDEHAFAVTTGRGYAVINDVCVKDFGFRLAGLFIDNLYVAAHGVNELGGNVHSSSRIYDDSVSLYDVQSTNSITKELVCKIKKTDIMQKLMPDAASMRKETRLMLKSSFKFGRSLNYDDLLKFLRNLISYAQKSGKTMYCLKDEINLVKRIGLDSEEGKKAQNALIKNILRSFNSPDGCMNAFSYFNENDWQFVRSGKYEIAKNDRSSIYAAIKEVTDSVIKDAYVKYSDMNGISAQNAVELLKFLQNVKIFSYDSDDHLLCEGTIINHISGEFESEGTFYFVVYGQFYAIHQNCRERIKRELKHFAMHVNDVKTILPVMPNSWTWTNEDSFNVEVSKLGGNQFVLFHKNSPQFVEFADVVYFEDKEVYLLHVKDKFDNSMRALCRQVELSVEKLRDFLHNNQNDYVNALYENAVTLWNEEESSGVLLEEHNASVVKMLELFPTKQEFAQKMKLVTFHYVMIVRNNEKPILNSRSVTALYCLNELRKQCIQKDVLLHLITI